MQDDIRPEPSKLKRPRSEDKEPQRKTVMAVENFDLFQDITQPAPSSLPKFSKKTDPPASVAAAVSKSQDSHDDVKVKRETMAIDSPSAVSIETPMSISVSYRKAPLLEQTDADAMVVDEPQQEVLPPGTFRSILSKTITPEVDPLKPRKKKKSVKFSTDLEKIKFFTAEETVGDVS